VTQFLEWGFPWFSSFSSGICRDGAFKWSRIPYVQTQVHIALTILSVHILRFILQTESLSNLRRMRWAGHVARMGEGRGVCGVLVGRPEGKRPLRRPRRRWEDNIKMDLRRQGSMGRTGFAWLWIGSGGGLLWTR
jgi:hypothetical protein